MGKNNIIYIQQRTPKEWWIWEQSASFEPRPECYRSADSRDNAIVCAFDYQQDIETEHGVHELDPYVESPKGIISEVPDDNKNTTINLLFSGGIFRSYTLNNNIEQWLRAGNPIEIKTIHPDHGEICRIEPDMPGHAFPTPPEE